MSGTGTQLAAVLGAVGKGFLTIDQLAEHLPIARKKITDRTSRLVTMGLLARLEKGVFTLTAAGTEHLESDHPFKSGPKKARHFLARQPTNTLRQRAWMAMRIQQRFTVPAIVTLAATDKDDNPAHNLQIYIRNLVRAGYVAQLPAREPGNAETSNGFKVFRLIRDTGERAPVWSKGRIIDRNTEGQNDLSAA